MTQPLALLLYEKLLPGTQLVNRLQDLGWCVQTIHDASTLARSAEEHKPVLILADLICARSPVLDATYAAVLAVALWMTIDLDRPRQGLIQVSYQPLVDALAAMK